MANDADTSGQPIETAHPGTADVVGYCDGDLSAEGTRRFESHLAACPGCRRRLQTAERVLAEVDRIVERPGLEWSADTDRLLDGLRATHAAMVRRGVVRRPRQPSPRFWLPLAGVGAIVGLVAAVQLLLAVKLPSVGKRLGGAFEGRAAEAAVPLVAPKP